MNFSDELKAFIEQRSPNGEDLSAAANYITTLASKGKTSMGLSQWQRSDKPVMEDFNEDNRIIDDNLSRLWANKADKGLPARHWLTALNGFESSTRYSKTQDGMVNLRLSVSKEGDAPFSNQDCFGVLPEGFRPLHSESFPVISDSIPAVITKRQILMVYINTDGEMRVSAVSGTAFENCQRVVGSLTFLAAD